MYWDHREVRDWLRGDSLMKTLFCYWTDLEKKGREEIGRVLFRRNRVGNGEKEEEEEEESRGRAAYADNALCLRKKITLHCWVYPPAVYDSQ